MKRLLVILLFLCVLTNPVFGTIKPIVLLQEEHTTIPFSGFLVCESDMLEIYSIVQREKILNKIILEQEEYFLFELKKLRKQTKVYFYEKPSFCFFAGMLMSIAMMFGAAKLSK